MKYNTNYVTNIIDDCLSYDEKITIKLLMDMNLINKIPLFGRYSKILLDKGLFSEYLKNTNNY